MEENIQKKKYIQEVLKRRFNSIKRIDLIKSDYQNFTLDKSCDVFLKDKIISVYENLSCKDKLFKSFFGNLSFKQAYVTAYFLNEIPRCCFCGQLLEISEKEDNKDEEYKQKHGVYPKYRYVIADIEHIFPKSKFPQLALHPNNLIPCCKECNESIKKDQFFAESPMEKFQKVMKDLNIDYKNNKPFKLWENYKLTYDDNINIIINRDICDEAAEFLNFYDIKNRIKIVASRCYNILYNIIKNSDICSPESLEKLLENIASSSWHEINDGYSLNNSPQIWQEFIENILYDECKLMALWDEIKSSELRFL